MGFEWTVVCEKCSAAGPHALDTEEVGDLAKNEGWKEGETGDWYCPDCHDEIPNAPKEGT